MYHLKLKCLKVSNYFIFFLFARWFSMFIYIKWPFNFNAASPSSEWNSVKKKNLVHEFGANLPKHFAINIEKNWTPEKNCCNYPKIWLDHDRMALSGTVGSGSTLIVKTFLAVFFISVLHTPKVIVSRYSNVFVCPFCFSHYYSYMSYQQAYSVFHYSIVGLLKSWIVIMNCWIKSKQWRPNFVFFLVLPVLFDQFLAHRLTRWADSIV